MDDELKLSWQTIDESLEEDYIKGISVCLKSINSVNQEVINSLLDELKGEVRLNVLTAQQLQDTELPIDYL